MSAPTINRPPSESQNPFLAAALDYADHGLRVIPIAPRGKRPQFAAWPEAATTDPVSVREWWNTWPAANVAIVTGRRSSVVALDVDHHGGGPDGVLALAELERTHGELPATWSGSTPGGGRRYFFRRPASERVRKWSPRDGIELLADGQCVIVPPSVHPNGRAYTWDPGRAPGEGVLAELPAWLLPPERPAPPPPELPAGLVSAGEASAWAEAALKAECARVAGTSKGGRNVALNAAAFNLGQIVGAGHLDRERVEAELFQAAHVCELVADDGEPAVRTTIRSGTTAGARSPRGPKLNSARPRSELRLVEGGPEPKPAEVVRAPFVVEGEQIALADRALSELADDPDPGVFIRARRLVRVSRTPRKKVRGLARPEGAPVIELLTPDALRDRLARLGAWLRRRGKSETDTMPPEWLVANLFARKLEDWTFQQLEAVIEAPTMRPDGSILDAPGFDEATGLRMCRARISRRCRTPRRKMSGRRR